MYFQVQYTNKQMSTRVMYRQEAKLANYGRYYQIRNNKEKFYGLIIQG